MGGFRLPAIIVNGTGAENIVMLDQVSRSSLRIIKRISQRSALYAVLRDASDSFRDFEPCQFQGGRQKIYHIPILIANTSFVFNAFWVKSNEGIMGPPFCIGILLPFPERSIGSLRPA